MDTAQWPQGFVVVKTGGETSNSKPNSAVEIKPRPEKDQALKCPRCNSTNTKFCYYNNYSLSQPRYFCKTCRRYWTAGGSLRNVPVGGGSRKNKRSSSTSAAAPAAKKIPSPPNFSPQNPRIQEGHDLNLAYNPSHFNAMSEFVALHQNHSSSDTSHHYNLPLMELLKTGNMCSAGGLSSFMSVPDFKPSLVDGFGGVQGVEDQTSRILFPLEDGKDQEREQNGYWNGMLAGGSW